MPQKATLAKAAQTRRVATGAAAYRAKREAGSWWKAPSGAVIRVRDLNLLDQAVIGVFPDHLQQVIYDVVSKSASLAAQANGQPVDPAESDIFGQMSGPELIAAMNDISEKLCLIGWVEPKVVTTVTDPETELAVDEIDINDRIAFMNRVFGGQQAEAMQLATFPDEQG